MIFVVIAIYAGAVFFCVGIAAGILRMWIRRQPHGLTDAHHLVVAVALVLSAAFGALLASNIVIALGYVG
jgi:hypothetical protein